ncbi:MAG TPA: 2-amino-4-hydroxy-6-hydroxymethyldihydropteridine diphosphokinase [Bryobacteraceae bacterium]
MTDIYLSLGSNLGSREEHLQRALDALASKGIRILARSSIYETEPRDVPDQPWFLNLVVACETDYAPLQLLDILQSIESEAGRVRGTEVVPKGPRTLDIDLLLFGDVVIDTPRLTVPHPRMLERRFVLEPLAEIAPDLRHPITKKPLSEYLGGVAEQRVTLIPQSNWRLP